MNTQDQPIFPKPFSLTEFLKSPEKVTNPKDWQDPCNYWNQCCLCGSHFMGDKKRSTCKECDQTA